MEKEITAERQLISIAHSLRGEGLVVATPVYDAFVKEMRLERLYGQSISEALKNGNRQEVYDFARILASEPFS